MVLIEFASQSATCKHGLRRFCLDCYLFLVSYCKIALNINSVYVFYMPRTELLEYLNFFIWTD